MAGKQAAPIVGVVAADVRGMDGTRNLVTNGELFIYGVVDSFAYDDTIRAVDVIDSLARLPPNADVYVRVNSPGGSVSEGIAIYNALKAEKRRVICQVDAMAASIASVIICAADEIVMAETASIMIHDPWSVAIGSADEMRSMADEIDRMKGIILDIYSKRSGLDREEISALMKAETYMSATEAVERGFADRVIEDLKVAACASIDRERLARMLFASQPAPDGGTSSGTAAAPAANQLEQDMNVAKPASAGHAPTPNPPAPQNQQPAPPPAAPAAPVPPVAPAAPVPPVAPAAPTTIDANALRDEGMRAERQRVSDIHSAVSSAGLGPELAASLVSEGVSIDVARERVIDAMAAARGRTAGGEIQPDLRVVRDERETLRVGMSEALFAMLSGASQFDERARPFMGATLVDLAAEATGNRSRLSTARAREDAIRNAFHSTSDFPIILENAVNRTLAARYAQLAPTYRRIATQRTYVDFRDHISVRAGDFPQLQPINENGEIKAGTFSESKEKTAVKAYAVRVNFSRQLLVNDSLNAIAQVLNSRADAVARFEETTFYAMMLSASAAGPMLLETSRAVFNTTDKTLASSGTVIDVSNLGKARAEIRKRKSLDGADLNLSPSILLVGPDKETEAQQITAPVNATQNSNVNPFSGKLETVVSAQITGNAWYLFCDPATLSNFEWGLLEGYTAPRMRMDEPFGVQGIAYSLEHDFGCGAINFRGGYRNPGA